MKKKYTLLILFLSIIVGGLFFLQCDVYRSSPTAIINPEQFKQEYSFAKITSHYQGKSDYIVVLIPNLHNSFLCQSDAYRTMELLVKRTRFVAREGIIFNANKLVGVFHWAFTGPIYFRTLENSNTRKVIAKMEYFVKLAKNIRVETVNQWIKSNQFPEGSEINWPVKASYLLEAVYQDEVKCVGVEDADTNMRAAIAVGMYEKGSIQFKKFVSEVLNPRNKSFVKNIKTVSRRDKKGDLVLFTVGVFHISGLKKLFEKEGISYIVLENKSCIPK